MLDSSAAELLSFTAADARLGGKLSGLFNCEYETVLLFDGDAVLTGDLLDAVTEIAGEEPELVVVTGDLTVSGRIALYEARPGLHVAGNTRAQTLEGGDTEIYLNGGAFTYLVYGDYNDGILDAGSVETPWVINYDHALGVEASGAYYVDNYRDSDDADFTPTNITESFVAEVVDPERDKIHVPAFLERLRAGLPVLRPDARTVAEAVLAEVADAQANHVFDLDLSGRKLKAFPAEVLRMPWLRTLVLDDNPITELPDAIGGLADLENLSVRHCGLTALPASVGQLTRLRVLRVADNTGSDDSRYSPTWSISLPDSIGELTGLEVLDVSRLSTPTGVDDPLSELTPFALPETAGNLVRLRRVLADYTNLVIPPSMHGLASLEEISVKGSRDKILTRFPQAVTTFPNLRRLDLHGTSFPHIPATLLRLTNLEELDLSSALGRVEPPLPDLTRLSALRVLDLSRTTRHTLLRQILDMGGRRWFQWRRRPALPGLRDLRIAHCGGNDRDGRPALTAEVIDGIGAFRGLKRLDLSFNGLTSLPDRLFTLPAIEAIDLRGNALDSAIRQRVLAAFPRARIDFGD